MTALKQRREKYLNPIAIIIIMAPSGSGKSHYVRFEDPRALDGDDIVSKSVGWPGPTWDGRLKDEATLVAHYVHWALICGVGSTIGEPVLFNGRVFARANTWLAIVDVPPQELSRNMQFRDPEHEVTFESYSRNLNGLQAGSKSEGHVIHNFSSIQAAVADARRWLKAQTRTPLTGWPKTRKGSR